jgi:hypothetical protein
MKVGARRRLAGRFTVIQRASEACHQVASGSERPGWLSSSEATCAGAPSESSPGEEDGRAQYSAPVSASW